MNEDYIGTIRIFAGYFVPLNYAYCDGSLLSISQYSSLFSILGTTYGGDGVTNFALPNLQGRVPVGTGHGPGLSTYNLGATGGTAAVTLTSDQMANHTHSMMTVNANASAATSESNFIAIPNKISGRDPVLTNGFAPDTSGSVVQMNPAGLSNAGGNIPHSNIQPYLGVNYVICIQGLFPSRS